MPAKYSLAMTMACAMTVSMTVGLCWAGEGGTAVATKTDDKAGPNTTVKGAVETTGDEQIEAVQLAHSLAKWGRANKSAPALAVAASIAEGVPTRPLKVDAKKSEGGKDGPAKSPASMDSAELYKEAKALAQGEAAAAVVDSIQKSGVRTKGPVDGPYMLRDCVRAFAMDSYKVVFRAGEVWTVAVSGDGDTDLDLYVFDDNGSLIDSDTDYTDDCICRNVPRYTGQFTIVIRNRGPVANCYRMWVQ